MIYAPLAKLNEYRAIPHLDDILQFMAGRDSLSLPTGEQSIIGCDLFLRMFRQESRDASSAQFETHKIYGDVHIVIQGVERIQIVSPEFLIPSTGYDEKNDIQLFTASSRISDIIVGPHEFVYFAPGEPHKPMCSVGMITDPITKLVFKVRV